MSKIKFKIEPVKDFKPFAGHLKKYWINFPDGTCFWTYLNPDKKWVLGGHESIVRDTLEELIQVDLKQRQDAKKCMIASYKHLKIREKTVTLRQHLDN